MALITMRTRAAVVLVISWVAVLPHCGPDSPPPPSCGGDADAACEAEAGPVCDPSKDPKDDPLCVSEAFGVFVSPSGDDANPGTKALPVQTIAKGISLTETVKRLYVCEGTYDEDVSIAPPADGISMFGGFSCSNWSYTGNKSHIGKTHLALAITSTTQPITIEDFYVHARDGVLGNPSSVAALVANATAPITFRRVSLDAGNGITGPDGVTGSNYDAQLAQTDAKIRGNIASGGTAGAAQSCANLCGDGKASGGGAGGAGGTSTSGGTSGSATPTISGLQSPNDGAGGAADTGSGCSAGHHGGDATIAGADGVSPSMLGSLVASGWNPTASADGTNGGTGEGGGGGGGASFADATHGGGGGGGCGGCGGAGGAAGVGGGSSIALAVLSSTVTLVASELHAGVAGDGGRGALGQGGQIGGAGGNGDALGCVGAGGGKGGTGGAGAGGVGGSSVAVLYKGTAPTTDSSTQASITFGGKGAKGLGANPGVNDGIDGVSMATMQLP